MGGVIAFGILSMPRARCHSCCARHLQEAACLPRGLWHNPHVADPFVALAALTLTLAQTSMMPTLDPGPHPACPDDMRLVEGEHHDSVYHLCLDPRKGGNKHMHCMAYWEGMTALQGPVSRIRVCMDRFEAPNRAGAPPKIMQSLHDATAWCEKLGKRVCTEQEWELGCEGPDHLPLAYGWAVNVKLCNSNKPWKAVDFDAFGKGREAAMAEANRLWQGAPSGRYQTCVSPFGIYDMNGNVEEWVSSRPGRPFPGALMGGFWAKPWTGCRGTNDAHQANFAFYETGFRCCKEPKRDAATASPPSPP